MSEEVQQESNQQGGDLLAVHDLDGTILSVNSALAEYLGYRDPADLLGRNLSEFMAPAERHLLEPGLADIAREGRSRGCSAAHERSGNAYRVPDTPAHKVVPRRWCERGAATSPRKRQQKICTRSTLPCVFSAPTRKSVGGSARHRQ